MANSCVLPLPKVLKFWSLRIAICNFSKTYPDPRSAKFFSSLQVTLLEDLLPLVPRLPRRYLKESSRSKFALNSIFNFKPIG